MKHKLLFVITQFYKGGAEMSLLNLFHLLHPDNFEVDFLILNQVECRDATSLTEFLPSWINSYDVVRNEGGTSLVTSLKKKVYRRVFHAETYGGKAAEFVKGKIYDAAFSYGEWLSPAFVVNKVNARKKYVWIHIDIDKANFVNSGELVKYNSKITKYLFASRTSMRGAVKKYPIMQGKSQVIHNYVNTQCILEKAKETFDYVYKDIPYLLSVGNLRVEKNYPRQIEVMKKLREKGISIKWLCVGSTVNDAVYKEVVEKIKKYHLEQEFLLCGADENPYKYMKSATAIMVLSDYESWSLVITEAKILGIPVIATDTSGAREQIINGKTGVITGFEVEDITNKVLYFLENAELQRTIRMNLQQEEKMKGELEEFERLLRE